MKVTREEKKEIDQAINGLIAMLIEARDYPDHVKELKIMGKEITTQNDDMAVICEITLKSPISIPLLSLKH